MRDKLQRRQNVDSWFPFLRIEVDLARTFISSAKVHSSPENSARSLRNARTALAEIRRALAIPAARGLSEDDVMFLEQCCVEIESALARF
jgi:cob(I)alamin adenosyltransferase